MGDGTLQETIEYIIEKEIENEDIDVILKNEETTTIIRNKTSDIA